jgi:hypothetical protein
VFLFLDVRKAYDSVSRFGAILLFKMLGSLYDRLDLDNRKYTPQRLTLERVKNQNTELQREVNIIEFPDTKRAYKKNVRAITKEEKKEAKNVLNPERQRIRKFGVTVHHEVRQRQGQKRRHEYA